MVPIIFNNFSIKLVFDKTIVIRNGIALVQKCVKQILGMDLVVFHF